MHLQQATPSGSLARWIHSYREYHFTSSDSGTFTCLPGTGAELWLPQAGTLGQACLPTGPGLLCLRTRRFEFRQSALKVFAIRFRAGSLPLFTHRPLSELVDHYTPVNALWDDVSVLRLAAIQQSPHFEEQCVLADRLLLSRLRADQRLEFMRQLANVMYEQSAGFALGDYAGQLQRDRSYLSRQFHDIQGISAKYFHRLCRFERFLRDALFATDPSLAGLALDHGYYDQAHMNNDVREISRESPRALLTRNESRLFYSRRVNPGQGVLQSPNVDRSE